MLKPIARFVEVMKLFVTTSNALMNSIRDRLINIVGILNRITVLVKRRTKFTKSSTSVRKVLALIIAGRRLYKLTNLLKRRGQSRYWWMFRLLMLAGPVLVPVLSSFRKMIRKPV